MAPRTETDPHGVVSEYREGGARITLKGRRVRHRPGPPATLDALPGDWRELLLRWARGGERRKWDTLLKEAGPSRIETARSLLDWLLRGGWASVEENRETALWKPVWVEFCNYPELRRWLGLAEDAEAVAAWAVAREQTFADPGLAAAALTLADLPALRALARHSLLAALENWREDGRHGTRRDFAQTARGDTKGVTAAEWVWLEAHLDLPAWGVERHAPLLLLRAPVSLAMSEGAIDLGAAPDFLALSPDAIGSAIAARGAPGCWRIVENRTSFERVARQYGSSDAVAWLPGFAPAWWKKAIARLLQWVPAPALIACDPDPAGIEIAVAAGETWNSAGLSWQPWKMAPADLAALPRRKPLTARDRQRLAVLARQPLPDPFPALLAWMSTQDEKGEQEGYL